jgi:eukaryotic-like serine/threonine-protein kinase
MNGNHWSVRMNDSQDPYATKSPDTRGSASVAIREITNQKISIAEYEILDEVGRGGMGIVYRARRHATGTILALKLLLCGRDVEFNDLARFRIEVEAMACLDHPNIIKIRDVGIVGGYPYLALEFAERGTLKELIKKHPQPPLRAAEVVKTLAFAMQYAHSKGMLHRDLKPANVLVMQDGTLKVSDFGLVKFAIPFGRMRSASRLPSELEVELDRFAAEFEAQYQPLNSDNLEEVIRISWQECAKRTGLLESGTPAAPISEFFNAATKTYNRRLGMQLPTFDELTRAGTVMGSPQYMAPEQAAGKVQDLGRQTDVYGLGGILYEMLTGEPPFRAPSLHELLDQVRSEVPIPPRHFDPTIPAQLESVCLKCLEKAPERRYSTAFALAETLHNFLSAEKGRCQQ